MLAGLELIVGRFCADLANETPEFFDKSRAREYSDLKRVISGPNQVEIGPKSGLGGRVQRVSGPVG